MAYSVNDRLHAGLDTHSPAVGPDLWLTYTIHYWSIVHHGKSFTLFTLVIRYSQVRCITSPTNWYYTPATKI